MEVEDIQAQGSKFPKTCGDFHKLGPPPNGDEDDDSKRGGGPVFGGWPQSRIVRVSRASGGKDRHSKVWTSKGLRDRRVRLSVHTAIQFYDLQDRLGYDQPSKAVEWLLKAASKSIDELPSINTSFPETPRQVSDENPVDSTQPHSSNSETSKELSLSRSENRIKARERAKERRAEREKKEKESESRALLNNNNHFSQQGSFTELLTGDGASLFHKQQRQWGSDPPSGDYFPMAQYHSQIHNQSQEQLLPHFSLVPDHMTDLSFTMSSSSGNMNRGTLQSNSPQSMLLPHHHQLHRLDGASVPFFIGTAAAPMEQHHHHQFPSGLQLYYGDGKDKRINHL